MCLRKKSLELSSAKFRPCLFYSYINALGLIVKCMDVCFMCKWLSKIYQSTFLQGACVKKINKFMEGQNGRLRSILQDILSASIRPWYHAYKERAGRKICRVCVWKQDTAPHARDEIPNRSKSREHLNCDKFKTFATTRQREIFEFSAGKVIKKKGGKRKRDERERGEEIFYFRDFWKLREVWKKKKGRMAMLVGHLELEERSVRHAHTPKPSRYMHRGHVSFLLTKALRFQIFTSCHSSTPGGS